MRLFRALQLEPYSTQAPSPETCKGSGSWVRITSLTFQCPKSKQAYAQQYQYACPPIQETSDGTKRVQTLLKLREVFNNHPAGS